jgi:riboflavin biosynthesis pyrimidine reductase
VLIEPGPRLLKSLLSCGIGDEIWWFRAPFALNEQGLKAGFDPGAILSSGYQLAHKQFFGQDELSLLTRTDHLKTDGAMLKELGRGISPNQEA